MHIPDGYLGPKTYIPLWLVSLSLWFVAFKKVKKESGGEGIALAGIFSALSFVLQMFNIPLPGGTTAHIVGTGAIAIILGPWLSFITISVVLVIQALLFADGGVTAIGANSFNMGFLFATSSYFIFRAFKNSTPQKKFIGAFLASYAGICISAFATALEIGIQPFIEVSAGGTPLYSPFPLKVSIPAMMIPHLLIVGIIEGLFTAFVVNYFMKNYPEVVR